MKETNMSEGKWLTRRENGKWNLCHVLNYKNNTCQIKLGISQDGSPKILLRINGENIGFYAKKINGEWQFRCPYPAIDMCEGNTNMLEAILATFNLPNQEVNDAIDELIKKLRNLYSEGIERRKMWGQHICRVCNERTIENVFWDNAPWMTVKEWGAVLRTIQELKPVIASRIWQRAIKEVTNKVAARRKMADIA